LPGGVLFIFTSNRSVLFGLATGREAKDGFVETCCNNRKIMLYCSWYLWYTVGGWPSLFPSKQEGKLLLLMSSIPQEGRVIIMGVNWSDFIQFCMLIVMVIHLVIDIKKK
jgi:hypothetical protein